MVAPSRGETMHKGAAQSEKGNAEMGKGPRSEVLRLAFSFTKKVPAGHRKPASGGRVHQG